MCVPVVCMRHATKALLSGGVPNLKFHLDAVDSDYLVLWTDGVSCSKVCTIFEYSNVRLLVLPKY